MNKVHVHGYYHTTHSLGWTNLLACLSPKLHSLKIYICIRKPYFHLVLWHNWRANAC